jgi:hypothetical protein
MMAPSPKMQQQQQQQSQKLPSPVPSFTQLEFPPLTPTTTLTKSEARSLKKEGDGKGEKSMTSCHASSWSNAVNATKEYDTDRKATVNDANDDVSSSTSSVRMWGIPPLPLLDMESTHSERHSLTQHVYVSIAE